MKSKKLSLALLISIFTLAIAPIASAVDIPLLSWERGKQQNIVLGGPSTGSGWKIFLVAQGQADREFSASVPNSAGYIVYSIDLPKNLPLGGYSAEARANGAPDSAVAAINVIERTFYTISSIPTDLRLLFTLYAIIVSSFAIIRARKYSYLSFNRDKSHRRSKGEDREGSRVPGILQPFYKFRSRRQAEMEISFLKFIAYKDGEPLHKISPILWSITPFVTFLLGMYMSYSIQATTVIPNVALYLIVIAAVVGAVDAISGATAAMGFIFASLILGDVNGMRSFLAVLAFTMAWTVPSMLASMYLIALKIDFSESFARVNSRLKTVLALALSAALGSVAVVISAILTDSLVINLQGNSFARWPLMAIVAAVIFFKNLLEMLIDRSRRAREVQVQIVEESIYLARVISPSMTSMLTVAFFGIIYVWTEKPAQSLVATAIIAAPFFLSFMVFPEVAGKRFPMIRRNLVLETLLISLITIAVYAGIQYLPLATREKAQAFILLGLVPVLIHAIYSALVVSSERSKLREGEVSA
ncbi:hypothetical protein MCEMRE185_01353 [Candidatus Nanopelagicaceae bacterium]